MLLPRQRAHLAPCQLTALLPGRTAAACLASQVERVRAELEVPLPQLSELPEAERLQVGARAAAVQGCARVAEC